MQGFGWESWRAYLHSFADPSFGPAPKNDDEKRDQWMVRFSRACGKNLGPFFQRWGVPTSDAARAAIADLPGWMPEELAPAPGESR